MATLASKAFEAAKPPPAATWNWQWIGWTVDRFGLLSSSHSPHYENSPQWTCLVIRINMGIENRWTCNYALIYMLRIWQHKKLLQIVLSNLPLHPLAFCPPHSLPWLHWDCELISLSRLAPRFLSSSSFQGYILFPVLSLGSPWVANFWNLDRFLSEP